MAIAQKWSTVENCRICLSGNLDPVIDLGLQPPANSLVAADEPEPVKVPLVVAMCDRCHSLQLRDNIDPNFLFSKYFL